MPLDKLLLETGDCLLSEEGDGILIEPSAIDPSEVVDSRLTDPVYYRMELGVTVFHDNGDS